MTANVTLTAARAGVHRGWIEFKQTFTNSMDLWGYLITPVVLLFVMVFMKDETVPGTDISLATMSLPSALGMTVLFGGLVGVAQSLTVEREDGTLLRAKATPNGMLAYLIAKIVLNTGVTIISFAILLIPGWILLGGLEASGIGSWLTLIWVVAVGLIATMPLGAVFGSLFSTPRQVSLIMLPFVGLVFISGIFYPITILPTWLQLLGQVFPMYWLGLGVRSALLPDAMVVVEIGQSWRPWETLGVLGAWAIVGILLAPPILRRMARRESGAAVAQRRDKAMQRIA